MNTPAKLVALCGRVGARVPLWTQGGGGNLSAKDPGHGRLYIKASGTRLDRVSLESGLAAAQLPDFRAALQNLPSPAAASEQAYAELLTAASLAGPNWGRLSMEAGFHAVLPKTFVLHFHSLPAILMAHKAQADSVAWQRWAAAHAPFSLTALPFVSPGAGLAFALANAAPADAYLLANHGLVAQTEDAGEFLDAWLAVERTFCRDFGYHEVLALLEAPNCLGFAQEKSQVPGAFKIVLPDVAVFAPRIRRVLEPAGELFRLKPGAWQTDPDACELWLATLILLRAAPEFSALSAAQGDHIAHLPSEKFRKGQ